MKRVWLWRVATFSLLLWSFYFGSSLAQNAAASAVPEITRIAPLWGPSGSVLSLTIQGRNLHEVSEVKFYPSTGIVVEEDPIVNSEGTIATVKVTILVHAPLGPRLVAVRTPAGQSSLTPTEANIFKVSYAHMN
jgi:hypothetical protein